MDGSRQGPLLSPDPDRFLVDVRSCRLDLTRIASESCRATLSGEERERADRYLRSDDRLRFTVGRAILRQCLGSRLRMAPRAVPLRQRRGSPPELEGDVGDRADVFFSVAHGGRFVVVAIATAPVGVDVEPVVASPPSATLVRRTCTPEEAEQLAGLGESARRRAFTLLWARKESVIKAARRPLEMSQIDARTGRVTVTAAGAGVGAEGAGAWMTLELELDAGHIGTVAAGHTGTVTAGHTGTVASGASISLRNETVDQDRFVSPGPELTGESSGTR